MKTIPIALITDNYYVMPTTVLLTSLKNTKNKNSVYKIYIISEWLKEETANIFHSFSSDDFSIEIIYAKNELKNTKTKFTFKSKNSYLKFEIPHLLKDYDKILYLDTDIIVCQDLRKLYSTDLKNAYAGVIEDYFIKKYRKKKLKALNLKNYFNSGIILFNAEIFREQNLNYFLKLFCERYGNVSEFRDQDAFNVVFRNRIKLLSPKYNWLSIYELQKNKIFILKFLDKFIIKSNKAIIHYAGKNFKPWEYNNVPLQERFLTYYNQSAYKDIPLNTVNNPALGL